MERRTKEDQHRGKRHTHPSGQEVGGLEASKNLKRSMIITIDLINGKSWCAPKLVEGAEKRGRAEGVRQR